jgi:hypothetical protein
MHPYELKIISFMKEIGAKSIPLDEALIKPAQKDVEHYLRKLYEEDPNRPFSLRLSAIGRPLCMQQMHKNKAPALDDEWNFPLKMAYGGMVEGLVVTLIKHAGIKIDEEQTNVQLIVDCEYKEPITYYLVQKQIRIPGTLDLVLDGRVWDVKSASEQSFKTKFSSYEALKADDTFGYIAQLYGYSKARELPPGGWIVVDKSTADIKFVPVPDNYEDDMVQSLTLIRNNVKVLLSNAEFRRCFEDTDEKFRKKFTGNRVLQSPCTYCKFKYSCWEGLQYLPVDNSTAFDKPYKYYTKHENKQLQSERTTTSEIDRLFDITDFPNAG